MNSKKFIKFVMRKVCNFLFTKAWTFKRAFVFLF